MPCKKGLIFPISVFKPVGRPVFLASRLKSVLEVRAAWVDSSSNTVMMSPTWKLRPRPNQASL